MIISYIHEHSLDNNDFETPEIYELETASLRNWIKYNKLINYENMGWHGHLGKLELNVVELLHYEP